MEVLRERQLSPVAQDEVASLVAVVRPILTGILNSLKYEVVQQFSGHDNIPLHMLARVYKPGDGDCGICFEYAVHDALNRGEGKVVERVADALRLCKVPGIVEPRSILFGAEKGGVLQLIDSARAILTDDSRLLHGGGGTPVKIIRYLDDVHAAFNSPQVRDDLPASISGLWKADLIIGRTDSDKWVAATVKINQAHLEQARGLRLAIVPTKHGRSDTIRKQGNLVICPLPHDADFMQTFYEGWRIVLAFLKADAQVPPPIALPLPAEREVARILAQRRSYPVRDVVHALGQFAQPDLLMSEDKHVKTYVVENRTFWSRLFFRNREKTITPLPMVVPTPTGTMLAPMPRSFAV